MTISELPPLPPMAFYRIEAPIRKVKNFSTTIPARDEYMLGTPSNLIDEEAFAEIGIAYHDDGLIVFAKVEESFSDCFFPDYTKGDALEIFIDTRNQKSAAQIHQFCHHFVILPKDRDGIQFAEVTRMRAEDSHPLANPEEATVETTFHKSSYSLKILIPNTILHGYDPDQQREIGFAYTAHRHKDKPQHFPLPPQIANLSRYPASWATLVL